MFEFINKWRKSRRSFWVLLITDGYLMGYHATGKRERCITSGCTFDGLNYLEWMDSMEPGPFRKGCITDLHGAEASIVKFLNQYGLDRCAKNTATVIFPKAVNPDHLKFIADVLKGQGFKEVNIYNPEIEIAIPGRRPMPEDERASFVERLRDADLEDCYPLVWDDMSFDLLAKENLYYTDYGCMCCGCDTVEIRYDRNEIFPNTNGHGTVHVCPKCMKLQRHKARGIYMTENRRQK